LRDNDGVNGQGGVLAGGVVTLRRSLGNALTLTDIITFA